MKPDLSYLLIVNPEAGSRRTMLALPEIDQILRREKVSYAFHFTNCRGHATELVRECGAAYDVIVSVGGDGTINEIVNGLPGLKKPLGMIPIGTGNDFARSCLVPYDDLEGAIAVLRNHSVRNVDVGQANDRRFINAMGIGFEGQVNAVGRRLMFIKGAARYIVAIAIPYFTYRRIPVRIRFGDTVLEDRTFLLSIGNGWNVGGGLQLTPKARLDDGLFDLCYVRSISRPRIIAVFNRLYDGTIDTVREMRHYQTDGLVIECDRHLPVHLDGEQLDPAPDRLEVRIHPAAQPVIGNWEADKRPHA